MDKSMMNEIQAGGGIACPTRKVERRGSTSSALTLTQIAINNLGGPVYASMTDHAPQDAAMAQAKTLIAIQKGGEKAVSKAPVDRAIAESLTMNAINSGIRRASLSHVQLKESGLTEQQKKDLQAAAAAEKERAAAARNFGGGDAKAGMGNILKEIAGQGGVIAVPAEKAALKNNNNSLNQTKTLMEITALNSQPVFASMTDHKPVDTALIQAQTLIAIQKKGEAKPGAGPVDRALNEALTMQAIEKSVARKSFKHVESPDTSLDTAKLQELQKQAIEEKAELAK